MSKFKSFLVRKNIEISAKRYFIDAMGSMALGLFASLLIGTIFATLGQYTGFEPFNTVATYAKMATGMAIGVAIAHKLGAEPLVLFSCAGVGAMANAMGAVVKDGSIISWAATASTGEAGSVFYGAGPAGAFFAVIIACEIGKMVSKETKVDILVTPVVTFAAGFLAEALAIIFSWRRRSISSLLPEKLERMRSTVIAMIISVDSAYIVGLTPSFVELYTMRDRFGYMSEDVK